MKLLEQQQQDQYRIWEQQNTDLRIQLEQAEEHERSSIEEMKKANAMAVAAEIENIKLMQGLYGIPKFLRANEYPNFSFKGKHNEGVFNEAYDRTIKRGKATGICMEYVGKYTLDDYIVLDKSNLTKVIFNACFIAYEIWINKSVNHGDLHRRNVVFDYCKPFQKTYYVGKYKFVLRNQVYKVK